MNKKRNNDSLPVLDCTSDAYWEPEAIRARYMERKRRARRRKLAISAAVLLPAAILILILCLLPSRGKDSGKKPPVTISTSTSEPAPDQSADEPAVRDAPEVPAPEPEEPVPAQEPVSEPELPEQSAPAEIAPEVEYRFAGERLSDSEKTLYASFVSELNQLQTEIVFHNEDTDAVLHAFEAVQRDYPEFFWLTGSSKWRTTTMGSETTIAFTPGTLMDASQAEAHRARLQTILSDLIAQTDGMSAYERILFYHDYLVENTTYDSDSLQAILDGSVDSPSSSAYGCLENHLAVCSGYSRALQWLAQESGIECLRVTGVSIESSEPHEWNCVKLDGDYYYIDATWDDPIPQDGKPERLTHDFFCITTRELRMTHTIDEGQNEPECTATALDYYRVNDLYYEVYDAEQIGSRIREMADAGETEFSFKFSSPEQADLAMADLIENQKFFEYAQVTGQITYTRSQAQMGLTIQT